MATPHMEANVGDIAPIVLMPGDPLRAKFISDNYLTDVKVVNRVRNMLGFTGYYKGKRISVMSSGMGIPSMGIYSYELYKFYNVDKIIRIGTCGEFSKDLNVLDIILVDQSYSDSTYALMQSGDSNNNIHSSKNLTDKIEEIAKNKGINIYRGNTYTCDVFTPYSNIPVNFEELKRKYNCVCTEMESFALFHNANVLNKEAACILTASDSLDDNIEISSEEREDSLTKMIELALESALQL